MPVDRLTSDDRVMLWPDEVWPQDIGALAILDGANLFDESGAFRIEVVRSVIESRLHLAPRFRRILQIPPWGLGGPLWVDAAAFDISEHVRAVAIPAPGDEEQLLAAVERLRRIRLDRSRPLWEMWVLTGLPEGRVGLFVRLHHIIADGIAGVATVSLFLDAVPDGSGPPTPPWLPEPPPSHRTLFVDNLRQIADDLRRGLSTLAHPIALVRHALDVWPAMRELVAEGPAVGTSLNRVIGPDRSLALVRSNIELVKQIAHAHSAKVNDVLLATIAGGVRALLRSRGEATDNVTVRVYVPISLRLDQKAPATGNLISQMVVPLLVGESDPVRRLHQISTETASRKATARPALGGVFRSRVVTAALLKFITRRPVNVTTADIPGPRAPLFFAGSRVLEVFPLMNLVGNVSLGVAALSYADQLSMLVVADRDAHPDLAIFVAGVRHTLSELAMSVSVLTSV